MTTTPPVEPPGDEPPEEPPAHDDRPSRWPCNFLRLEDWGRNTGTIGLIISILGAVISLAVFVSQFFLTSSIQRVGAGVDQLTGNRFSIQSPESGVGEFETIRGTTPYGDRNHYVVVDPEVNSESWVHGPATVTGTTWSASVQFGHGTVGLNKKFRIRCLATKSTIPSGRLLSVPEDAIFSEPITVERTK